MPVDLGNIFSKGLRYAADLKRMTPFFILNLIIVVLFFVLIWFFFNNLPELISAFKNLTEAAGPSVLAPLIPFLTYVLLFVAVVIIVSLVKMFYVSVINDNARLFWTKKKDAAFSKSYGVVKSAYISLLFATILAGIITALAGQFPFIGFILAFITAWMFLLIAPSVVIGKKGAIDALRESYYIFMDHKWDVVVFWIVLVVATTALTLVALIPFILSALPVIMEILPLLTSSGVNTNVMTSLAIFTDTSSLGGTELLLALADSIKANLSLLFIGSVISTFILAYKEVFEHGVKAFYYIEIKKASKKS